MKSCLVLTFLTILLSPSAFGCKSLSSTSNIPQKDWWQTAQFYQIFPRSFRNLDLDCGWEGDLKGMTSRLDYLKEIGVSAFWLPPIYKSPMKQFGKDISDFFDIHEKYGTICDFDELIREANKRGMKVIMNFVPNHTSDEHIWFKKSVNREKGYKDFYVWHDGKKDAQGNRMPPSNWLEEFRGSAWQWNEQRQQYYLHQFVENQPDLNYRNPDVVAQMKRILTYWLNRGVAGFYIDAVPKCFEVDVDATGNYPDEPVSGLTDDPKHPHYLKRIYTQDQPETIDMIYQWRKLMDDYQNIHGGDTRVLMVSSYSDFDKIMPMYGNKTTEGAQIPLNFKFIQNGDEDSEPQKYVEIIESWFDNMPAGKTPNWVMGNDDSTRVGIKYGEQRIDTMNMIQMILPGVSVTYNGEELGMLDREMTWSQTVDPADCNSDLTINVQRNTKSHLNVYKQMAELRKTDVLKYGTVRYGLVGNGVLVIRRSYKGKSYIFLANVQSNPESVNLSANNQLGISGLLKVKVPGIISTRQVGDFVQSNSVDLKAYEAVVLESS